MNTLYRRTWWLSLLIMLSLLTQSVIPLARPAQAMQPAPEVGQTSGRSLATAAKQLEHALLQLEEAPTDAATRDARHVVDLAWSQLASVELETRNELTVREQDLTTRGLRKAHGRQTSRKLEHTQRMDRLKGRYQALVAAGNRQARTNAAAALRKDLRASLDAATAAPPTLDLLPNRPAPTTRSVEQRPALTRSGSAPASDQPVVYSSTSAAALHLTAPTVTLPSAADLASTEDATITPEIQALANQLGRNPTRIYEYVRNKISFEPYYGSRKGALLTLWERGGNDIDTASLLIALLRASGFNARYVQGTVAVDETRVRNWVGNAPDLGVAASILATGGVPVALTPDGYLVKEHVWVEVYDPDKTFADFNGNGRIDVGDVQTVSRALSTTNATYDFDRDGTVDQDDVQFVVSRWKQAVTGGGWVALDASFKQFTFAEPANLQTITGFNAEQYVDEMRTLSRVDDVQKSIVGLPTVSLLGANEDDDEYRDFADLKVEQAVSDTLTYIQSQPQLTNVDLLGGAYIITETVTTLPAELPTLVLPNEPITTYSEVPAARRDYVTIQLYDTFGDLDLSYRASYPSLANRRVVIAYEAATPDDQAVINSYGGSLLTTPPVVDLVPVLRVNGVEVARGSAAPMGAAQTRSLTFTDANGVNSTVQNAMSVGEMFAVGLAYGRTSKDAIKASQQRLAAARDALPKHANGDPDPYAPGNMAEPVIGETLHLSLQAYFNQLDTFSEVVARGQDIRWFRYLSAGTAIQNLVFSYCFGGPCQTRGGGQTFDIQQNVVSGLSLANRPADERIFLQTTGYFSSALEHSLFGNLGKGAVSSIQLLELALTKQIPVYRINAANKAAVFPLLQLDADTEFTIASAIDQGKTVTVSQRPISVKDWSGVGYIIMDPSTGAAAYLISGGLFGQTSTMNGGSLWDILKTIGAYAWLAINMGLDLWGIWSGIALLLVPEPTMISKVAGIGLIVANLVALGFDIADLWGLIDGSKSEQEYIGEQLTGLILSAILKRVGISAAQQIIENLGEETIPRVISQLDELTDGAISRLTRGCGAFRTRGRGLAAPLLQCPGLTQQEIFTFTSKVGNDPANWTVLADLSNRISSLPNSGKTGGQAVKDLLNHNDLSATPDTIQKVARTLVDAPYERNGVPIPNYDKVVAGATSGLGESFQLARANVYGSAVRAYESAAGTVSFKAFDRYDAATGQPIFKTTDSTELLEGDIELDGGIFIEAKWADPGANKGRVWNQLQKAIAEFSSPSPRIQQFRIEAAAQLDPAYHQYLADAIANNPALSGKIVILDNLGNPFTP